MARPYDMLEDVLVQQSDGQFFVCELHYVLTHKWQPDDIVCYWRVKHLRE